MKTKLLSLCIAVYQEEEVILTFISEVTKELERLQVDYEIIFVDDGSTDKTVSLISEAIKDNTQIRLIEFSYNHGKQAAITAAIAHAKGGTLLYMDPDLQDPPHEIGQFLKKMDEGYDLVFGVRKEKKDSLLNRLYSKVFWSSLNTYTGLQIPKGLAVMRMFNREFADQFLSYKEQNRFIEGIFMRIGMNYTTIKIDQEERRAGTTKYNFKKKMKLAFDAIFDFSELPLRLAVSFGVLLSMLGFILAVVIFILHLSIIDFKAGWPSLITAIIFSTGLQVFFIGIAALYIGRIYLETKQRPLYSIKRTYNLDQ
ncbi:MAG TPA: glycosyltransferase [Flavobacteriales bacterium]|nr:glycosyltransferase [Flavobacteriales bacterium]